MSHESFLSGKVMLCCGDSLHFLRDQPDNRYDSIVTDPPYALVSITKRFGANGSAPVKVPEGGSGAYARASAGFMGKKWDTGETAFAIEFWEQCLRVLKPGGHVVAFGGTRTYHRLACAIEDSGFEIRDQFAWTYGTGFNKKGYIFRDENDRPIGPWGGAVKPAWEPICVARKNVIGTVADNIRKYGTGAFNIDGCRVEMSDSDAAYITERINGFNNSKSIGAIGSGILGGGKIMDRGTNYDASKGRWPANIIHDGSDEVVSTFPIVGDAHAPSNEGSIRQNQVFGADNRPREFHAGFSDAGSAARFFYTAKADSDDRLGSRHPTVKPVDLMQWLVRLVTPKGGLVLDPFAGTGTTAEACYREGMRCVLIERETEYQADIRRRMVLVMSGPGERSRESIKEKTKNQPIDAGPLFDTTH